MAYKSLFWHPNKSNIFSLTERSFYKKRMENFQEILSILHNKELKLSTAESVTGGGLAQQITHYPGASNIFQGGIILYTNSSKISFLGKKAKKIIENRETISKKMVILMAQKSLSFFKSQITIATSGNAGPTTIENKKLGLIYFSISTPSSHYPFKLIIKGKNREEIREKITKRIWKELLNILKSPTFLTKGEQKA